MNKGIEIRHERTVYRSMNGQKDYYLKEAYRHLGLALIGVRKSTREQIELAIENLKKYEKQKK